MLEIRRSTYSVIVYDESENRGITFPIDDSTEVNHFVEEVQKLAEGMKKGMILIPLLFDPNYSTNYRPMGKYLDGKEGPQILRDDIRVRELYDFYFSHSIPEIIPAGINYIFLG